MSRCGAVTECVIANVLNVGCKDIRGYCSDTGAQGRRAAGAAGKECSRCQHGLKSASKSSPNEQIQLILRDCPWPFPTTFLTKRTLWQKKSRAWIWFWHNSDCWCWSCQCQVLVKFWCKSLGLIWYSADPSSLMLHRSLLRRAEYPHKLLTSHKLWEQSGERTLIALLSHQGHCVQAAAATLHSGLSNETNHFVLI